MRKIACVVLLAGALSGCAVLDDLLDVDDGKAPEDVPAVVEQAQEGLGLLPYGGILAAILGGGAVLYRKVRRKEPDAEAASSVDGIE